MTVTSTTTSEGAAGAQAMPVSDSAWKCLQGAYDLQVHVAPDVIERRVDDLDLAKEFLARGLRGFVLKSHYFPTAERAKVVTKAVPGIAAYGAITLNHSVGGLNPVALELAGRSGCKVVWFPTVDAQNETAGRLDGPNVKLPFWAKIQRELAATGINPPPLTVVDSNGTITGSVAISCATISQSGCTAHDSDCTWTSQGYSFTTTTDVTFASDGSSATGLETVSGSGNGQSCTRTYQLTMTRQ